jgi:hypothetical protein
MIDKCKGCGENHIIKTGMWLALYCNKCFNLIPIDHIPPEQHEKYILSKLKARRINGYKG